MEGHDMPRIPLTVFSRAAACAAALAACGTATSAPPTAHPAAAQGHSAVDRALESRARLADRAADAARHATTNAGAGAGAADAIGRAQNDAANRAGTNLNGVGLGIGGNAGGHASAASNGVGLGIGGTAKGHASPQAGTGRLSRDLRAISGQANDRNRMAPHAAGTSGAGATSSGLSLGWLKRNEHASVRQVSGETAGSARVGGADRSDAEHRGFDLTRADRLLAHRLAQIERMRDRAVDTKDDGLLRQADRLEVIARAQYSQRTDGETSVGEPVRTFNASQRDMRDVSDDHGGATTDPDGGTMPTDGGTATTDDNTTPTEGGDSTPVNPSAGQP
jgi:hypothetical protein